MKAGTRKPAHLQAAAEGPRQRIWREIRRAPAEFSTLTIQAATGLHIETIRNYLNALQAGGIIERLELGTRPQCYRLLHDGGVEAPRLTPKGQPVMHGVAQENMWRAMRIIQSFTALELAAAASTETVTVAVVHAGHYCRQLVKAGYLAIIEKGGGRGKRATRWQFIPARWTGPHAPVVERLDIVWDANTREIVWHGEPGE